LLAARVRWRVRPYPPLWRISVLLTGAVVAVDEIGWQGDPRQFFVPLTAAAVFGIPAVVVATRLLPPSGHQWRLGVEKGHETA